MHAILVLATINNGNGVDHDSMTVYKTSSKQIAFAFGALKIHYYTSNKFQLHII